MKVEQVLALPEGLEVTNIDVIDGVLTISAVSTQTSVCCPLCSSVGTRVHSHYTRTIADLPCAGQPVRLLVQVRKFFCDVSTCARKIFVERLAPFVVPLARVTTRLSESVQVIGFATGGMLGARLTDRLGIQTCWMTILRRMMARPTALVEQVVELGIDDFAFRRGRKFGSILVDMQSHNVIDLLPDRKAETAAAWMGAHPEIELVSRDRGGDYAAGARQGAPQATQVADRFHLYSAPHRRVFDPFWRKERLRAHDLWGGGLPGGKPQGDSSMPQSRTGPKAFRARSDCPAHHGEATLPNLAYRRR